MYLCTTKDYNNGNYIESADIDKIDCLIVADFNDEGLAGCGALSKGYDYWIDRYHYAGVLGVISMTIILRTVLK